MSTVTGAKVIIVGGGLAGLSAAHTVLERGGRALVLDKKDFLGGNSVKATSGINGALTNTQIKLGIPDSAEIFEKDTALSANKGVSADSTPLIRTLTYESAPAVEWLIESFNLDLSLISRLGGHSQPRTHRGKERFPGMTITYALMEKFEDIASKDPSRAQVIVNAKVTKLLEDSGSVVGVEYERDGQTTTEVGPVVIATGGFGADFSETSILKQVRPDLMHLPTTNGDHCTGDGIKLSQALGGATIDLPAVQVHPTGLVHPKEPDAKIKFLAAEALRGVGGLLLDRNGKRFCNELGTRDYVTGEMWKRDAAPYRLVLNGKGVKEIEWHIKHYCGRGLMRMAKGGDALAKELGVDSKSVATTFRQYNEAAKKGGDEFNKKYFQNLPWEPQDEFAVAIVTPVIHYCISEGTLVNLADGTSLPIEQVKVGAHVLSYYAALADGETAGLVVRQVDAVLDQGSKQCVELLFSDGRTLVCTPDHRICTADGQWVAAGDLEVGTAEVAAGVEYPHVTAAASVELARRLGTQAALGDDLNMDEYSTTAPCGKTKAGYAKLKAMQSQGVTVSPRRRKGDEIDPSRSYQIRSDFGNSIVAAFASCVGFRYCHKQQRLSAAVAYFRGNERLLEEKAQVSARIVEQRRTMSIPAALRQAKVEFAQREQLLPEVARWEPIDAGHLHVTKRKKKGGASTAAQLLAMDSRRVFSDPRTKKRYNAAERRAELAAAAAAASYASTDDDSPTADSEPRAGAEVISLIDDGEDGEAEDVDVYQAVDKVSYGVHRDAQVLPLFRVRLVGRREVGTRRVYDLSVPSPQGDAGRSFMAAGVVVHNCMGGVAINEKAEILKEKGGVIPGLWAGGEVAGGVHGKNRLGGSGLLGAVVYGRVAGASASKFLLDQLSVQRAERRLGAVSQQLFNSFHLQSSADSLVITLSYANDQNGGAAAASSSSGSHHAATASSSSTHPAAASPAASSSSSAAASKGGKAAGGGKERPAQKQYSMEEVGQHASDSDCWVVVNGQVLNATPFLSKHPGGREAILLYAGKDATEEFNMLHKPDVVEKYAPEIIIGTVKK